MRAFTDRELERIDRLVERQQERGHTATRILPLRRRIFKSERHYALDEHASLHFREGDPQWLRQSLRGKPAPVSFLRSLPCRLRFVLALAGAALFYWGTR